MEFGDFKSQQRKDQLPADPGTTRFPGSRTLADAGREFDATPNGPLLGCVDVRSVYDARPINAFDFNIFSQFLNPSVSNADVTFTVPEGFVCVLRSFDIWLDPNNALTKNAVTWTLILQGTAFPYNEGIPFGGAVDREQVFLVADEFNIVGVRIAGSIITALTELNARFYGQFLPKTGLQAAQEIGNKTQNCGPMAVRPAQPVQVPRMPDTPPLATMPAPQQQPPRPFPQELAPRSVLTTPRPPSPPQSPGRIVRAGRNK